MPNQAFQNSLRSRDKDRFVASLKDGGALKEIVVTAPKTGDEWYSYGGGNREIPRESGRRYQNVKINEIEGEQNKELEELEEWGDRPPSNWFEGLDDETKEAIIKKQKKENLEKDLEKIKKRGDRVYSAAQA